MSRALFAVVLAFPLIALANPHYRPDVEVNVPPEVFSSGGQSAQPCTQCCVYQDKNYSEGAVIKAEEYCCNASVMTKPLALIRWSGGA